MTSTTVGLVQRVRDAVSVIVGKRALSSVPGRGRFLGFVMDNDFQTDIAINADTALSFSTAFACVTTIASDVSKLSLRLMTKVGSVWEETDVSTYSPLLREPNHFQTRQQFIETWQLSKQSRGNTYGLLARDGAGNVRAIYILDPLRVRPLVAPNGDVFYGLNSDDLSRLPYDIEAVPASEIIHDRFNCLFHPLVGLSPLYACSLAAAQGLNIQKNAAKLFANMSRPGGILTAPGEISDETAERLKTQWEKNYSGNNVGKIAVLGDDLKFQALAMKADEAQMAEMLGLSDQQVARAFKVPAFLVGIGDAPSYDNVQALWQQYYSQCLQAQIEAVETLLDRAMRLDPRVYRTEFDLDDLLRMDSATLAEVEGTLVQRGISAPNEARRKFGRGPVAGGETPYLQQQNFSLAALAKRDSQDDPFKTGGSAPAAALMLEPSSGKGQKAAIVQAIKAEMATALNDSPVVARLDNALGEVLCTVQALAAELVVHKDALMALAGRQPEEGAQGEPGEMGPMPKHQWDGTRLRFEQGPDGRPWGPWVDLKGERGYQGISGVVVQKVNGPGGSGTAAYRHVQSTASDTWTIHHNLGMRPNVTVINSAGDEVEGDSDYPNENTVVLTFGAAFSGEAYLS
ncbi:phage portal protein [Piscinibacter sp.]|uniref:phage portal protein n=1 Tax=Piscinibacter sp. TaxID=1903157 RepID=UPI0039E41F2E